MDTIAIIGASKTKSKYGYKAVRAYDLAGFKVFPINPKEKEIAELKCYKSVLDVKEPISTASFYVPPSVGEKVVVEVIKKKVKKVFLNPGSESDFIVEKLEKTKIEVVKACSILAIGFHPDAIDE